MAESVAPTADSVYKLQSLMEVDALALLERLTPSAVATNASECRELVRDLEGLPLAVQVAGRLPESEARHGFAVTDLLRDLRSGAALLAAKAPADRTDIESEVIPTVAALRAKSTDMLEPELRQRFAKLGAFAPKPATFRSAYAAKLWAIDDVRPTLGELTDRGLVEASGSDHFQIHSVLVMHARTLLAV